MAIRANHFALKLNKHFGDKPGDLTGISPSEFEFVGDQFQTTFVVEGEPTGVGYFLIQTFDVNANGTPHESGHQLLINGKTVDGFNKGLALAPQTPQTWNTWMDVIEGSTTLQKGANTIKVQRALGGDNFLVGFMTINWLESD
jgi:hypothetical protein